MTQQRAHYRAELLAPAGDWEALRAAAANGADAVYFGLPDFNARHRAANFTLENLPAVVEFLHARNVRAYVTFNTLIFSDELPQARTYLAALAAAGVDAVIVQDVGLAKLARSYAPGLELHGSTQMTLTEAGGIGLAGEWGLARVIVARELSLADLKAMQGNCPLPLEVFVHGALCVAYSGQCLTSESLGGRSANRGRCAQACRLPYDLVVDGKPRDMEDLSYLLSPQDLAAHDLVGELLEAGVGSIKIEGRLKSAHYVAAATQTYRKALDAALAGDKYRLTPAEEQELAQSFSRGFSPGFLRGVNHQELVHGRFPKNRGVRIGKVTGRSERGVLITAEVASNLMLKPGDGVVFDEGHPEQDEQGGRVYEVKPLGGGGKKQWELTFGAGVIHPQAVAVGAMVWKTDDPSIRRRLEQSFARDTVARREGLQAHVTWMRDRRLAVELVDARGRSGRSITPAPLEAARKHPLTQALALEQLGRLGDTPWELEAVHLWEEQEDGKKSAGTLGVMAPKSVLNELRREAAAQLQMAAGRDRPIEIAQAQALDHLRLEVRTHYPPTAKPAPAAVLHVMVRRLGQLAAVLRWLGKDQGIMPGRILCDFENPRDHAAAVAQARGAGAKIALATLRVIKPGEYGLLKALGELQPDAILVRNLAGLAYYRKAFPHLRLEGDYSLNVTNELAAGVYLDAGCARLTAGYDLNWAQLAAMLRRVDAGRFELVLHQHMPMFHMEHCVFAHTLSQGKDFRDCGRPCETHRVTLRDRAGVEHPLLADIGCRNTVYNGVAQTAATYVSQARELGLQDFRVELLREEAMEVDALLDRYAGILSGKEDAKQAVRSLHVLTTLGVTPGTYAHE